MQIRIRLYARFREIAGKEELDVEGVSTLMDVRKLLSKELGVDPQEINFIVYGKRQPDELKLDENAIVIAFPRVSGG